MGVNMASKMVSFRLPEFAYDQLKQLAKDFNCSMTVVIIALIRWQFIQEEGIDLDKFDEMIKIVK